MMRFQHPKRIFRIGNLGVLVRDTEMPSNLFQPRRPRKRLDVELGICSHSDGLVRDHVLMNLVIDSISLNRNSCAQDMDMI